MVLESMLRRLSAVKAYNTYSTILRTELNAYASELELLYSELGAAFEERFIETATDEGLRAYEELFGPAREELSVARRRELLQKRLTLGESDFTLDGIKKALDSFGLSYTINEYPRQQRLNILAEADYPPEERALIRQETAKIMPAHLDWQLVFNSLTWDQLDQRGRSFIQLDNDNLTWEQIDALE